MSSSEQIDNNESFDSDDLSWLVEGGFPEENKQKTKVHPTSDPMYSTKDGDGQQVFEARRQLAALRNKLLDLSKRNRLLNYRHSRRSRDHIRIVDEVLSRIFEQLCEGDSPLTFAPLPEPNAAMLDPEDENSDQFQAYLREERQSEAFQEKIEKIHSRTNENEGEESYEDELNRLEREIRDRIRKILGMPPIRKDPNQTNASWARQNGVNPSFSLLRGNEASKPSHHDDRLQTLLLPDEMEAKLKSIHQLRNYSIREKGINTLYAAFGFVEWRESEDSEERFHAPLVLLPITLEKEIRAGNIVYKVQGLSDDPVRNETLAAKFQDQLQLPDFDTEMGIEAYIEKVEEVISTRGWRVRRFFTVGHFSFHRLAMYQDLDPRQWPSDQKPFHHKIVRQLLGGLGESIGLGDREVYNPDDDAFTESAPHLVRDADSSQFSAVVDVLEGENLVIQGPPGTGKSQTIANIIAAAMFEKKTILFVAEKLSALEVVKSRLDADGIGDFCFELHSAKASKAEVLAKIKDRLKMRSNPSPTLPDRRYELQEAKAKLSRYLATVAEEVGGSGITVEKALWMARGKTYRNLPERFRKFRLVGVECWRPDQREEVKNLLRQLALAESELSESPHLTPWRFIGKPNLSINDFFEIRDLLRNIEKNSRLIAEEMDRFSDKVQWNFPRVLKGLSETLEILQKLPAPNGPQERYAYDLLADQSIRKRLNKVIDLKEKFYLLDHSLRERCGFDGLNATQIKSEIRECLGLLQEIDPSIESIAGYSSFAETLRNRVEKARRVIAVYRECCESLPISDEDPTEENLSALLRFKDAANELDAAFMDERKPVLFQGQARQKLLALETERIELRKKVARLQRALGMTEKMHPSSHVRAYRQALENRGAFGWMKPSVRAANRFAAGLYDDQRKRPLLEIIGDLQSLEEVLTANEDFIERESVQCFLKGEQREWAEFFPAAESFLDGWSKLTNGIVDDSPIGTSLHRFLEEAPSSVVFDLRSKIEQHETDIKAWLRELGSASYNDLTDLVSAEFDQAIKLEEICTRIFGAGISPNETHTTLNETVDLLENHIALSESVQALAAEIGNLLPDLPVNEALKILEKVLPLAEKVQQSPIDPSLKASLTSSGGGARLEASKQNIDPLYKLALKQVACLGSLEKYCPNGLPDYHEGEVEALILECQNLREKDSDLEPWCEWRSSLQNISKSAGSSLCDLIRELFTAVEILEHYDFFVGQQLSEIALATYPELESMSGMQLEQARQKIREIDGGLKEVAKREVIARLYSRGNQAPSGNGMGGKLDLTELSLLNHLKGLKCMPYQMSTARVIKQGGEALQCLTPCFMMSPLSVAHYIHKGGLTFDLVIFDEASQILPEDAMGAILRGRQFVVVGDSMQLPPTSFFASNYDEIKDSDDEDSVIIEDSILEKAEAIFQPPRRLLWHYRSKDLALIQFSNKEFYDNELLIFPSPFSKHPLMGVKYEWTGGRYVGRSNPIEADAVVAAAIEFMSEFPRKSLGIVALNAVQRDLIMSKLDHAMSGNSQADQYRKHHESTLEPLFVKNLESVQGDERDVIFISTVFGRSPGSEARPAQRFGPINSDVGHRRLNVLFTRAKETVRVFTSLRPEDVQVGEPASRGRKVLRRYLEYARSGRLETGEPSGRDPDSEFEIQVRERLRSQGYDADCQVGVAGYFVDLAVKHPQAPNHYLLAVECDGAKYHSFKSARDRDRLRQDIIESHGWEVHRIWSTDWFKDPEREMKNLARRIIELQATTRAVPLAGRSKETFLSTSSGSPPSEESG